MRGSRRALAAGRWRSSFNAPAFSGAVGGIPTAASLKDAQGARTGAILGNFVVVLVQSVDGRRQNTVARVGFPLRVVQLIAAAPQAAANREGRGRG
jgi:hypothetical protein